MNRKGSGTKRTLLIINVMLLLGLTASTAYLFMKNRDLNDQITLTSDEKNRRLVAEINKVYKLPEEDPVVAVVTNPEEFKQQYTSFTDAQNGDYLLFFRKARLNVLYRQSEKRVVTTADVVVPIAVEIVGKTEAVEAAAKRLEKFGQQVTITKTINDEVTQNFVFDVDDDQKTEAESISKELGYDVGTTLPTTIKPSAQTELVIAAVDAPATQITE
jgi:hypothetical protein